ncbi:MAG TPA: phosphoribosylglycinamide formyltransferase [Steroidobacteraceae bacterium]|nr:phosphoribosylglycinamide formyltransferase [Steroidobacteraceae bacterium]
MSRPAPFRITILISGRGSNMTAIARACLAGTLDAEVTDVISDRAEAAGLAAARDLGAATATVPRPPGLSSADFEAQLVRAIEAARPDAIALAGFMRILSTPFVERYLGRMLNIHPSLLPAYRGLHTHRRVLAAGEAEHGASVHFVTPELDAGPIVLQSKVRVHPDDSEDSLAARVIATEHVIYPRVLGWFAQRRLQWHDGGAWLDGTRLETPIVEDFRAAAI